MGSLVIGPRRAGSLQTEAPPFKGREHQTDSVDGKEDELVVAASERGTSQAFEFLIERHAQRIPGAARRVTGN
jgi:hypothetical protein